MLSVKAKTTVGNKIVGFWCKRGDDNRYCYIPAQQAVNYIKDGYLSDIKYNPRTGGFEGVSINVKHLPTLPLYKGYPRDLPCINLNTVYHTGTMQFSKKQLGSPLGRGLPFTREIGDNLPLNASLNDGAINKLTKPKGIFVNACQLTDEMEEQIYLLGLLENLIDLKVTYEVHDYNETTGATNISTYSSLKHAQQKKKANSKISTCVDYIATPLLAQKTHQDPRIELKYPFDLLLTYFCDYFWTKDVDGIYWHLRKPSRGYVGQCGVIFNGHVGTWQREIVGNRFKPNKA